MKNKHLFPWWAGYLLISPMRRLSLDPDKILGDYIKEGMTVIDAGCAMGYFSLPIARMVGKNGKVLCVDLQDRMLKTLKKRAAAAGLEKQIIARECTDQWLKIDDFYGRADAAIAFGVVHEAPDERAFIEDLARGIKPGGTLIIGEPRGPVKEPVFIKTVRIAEKTGFSMESMTVKRSCRIAFFRKREP